MELRLGIVGMGSAARALLPAVEKHPDVRLTAICDPLAEVRDPAAQRYGARSVADIATLLALADVDAVYVATPTDLHAQHVIAAANAGKHILCEKPMATTLDEAQAMIDAADRAGVAFNVGHSHSYDEPYRAMRELIASGELGRARMMHNIYYSDWVYRPRRPEELDANLGGGITFRQGAHQFDILRLLGGGMVKSVRAQTFDWDPAAAGDRRTQRLPHLCRRHGRDGHLQRLRRVPHLGDHLRCGRGWRIRKRPSRANRAPR